MTLGKLWTIAYRDLGRNRRRTLFTLIAVALGLALLITLNGFIAGVWQDSIQNSIRLRTGHVQVRAAAYEEEKVSLKWEDLLTDADALAAQARGLSQVKAAAPVLWATSILQTANDSVGLRLYGIDPTSSLHEPIRDGLVAGEYLTPDDRSGILLGKRLADTLGLRVGQNVSLTVIDADGQPDEALFTVRGLYATGIPTYDDSAAFLPLAKAQAFTRAGNRASAVVILLHRQQDADAVAATLRSLGVAALTWEEMHQVLIQALETGLGFYVILDGIVMLVVAVIIANTLLMAVFERVREVGILAALGMKGRQILLMFLLQALILGLFGVLLGFGLGSAAVWYLATVGIDAGEMASAAPEFAMGSTMYARFIPGTFASLSLWTLVIILLASLYPAWYAARLEPVRALHAV